MFYKKTFIFTTSLCLLFCGLSFYSAYTIFNNKDMGTDIGSVEKKPIDVSAKNETENKSSESLEKDSSITDNEAVENEVVEAATKTEKITPSTKMVYRYYYVDDDITEEQEDVPPYFMIDLTLDDMIKYYQDWDIVSFSGKEVIMQKTVAGKSNQRYVVGEHDGYVAVFYEEEKDGISLHEVTDTPVSSLTHEEQVRLTDGISVVGENNLIKVLEDYGS